MKKLLFVVNTLGTAGAEKALAEMLSRIDPSQYECNLFVLMNQGNLISEIPGYVKLLNKKYDDSDVLSKKGRRHIARYTFLSMFRNGAGFKYFGYIFREFLEMKKTGKVLFDKLLWQVIACGAPRFKDKFDLAVAFHEGGASYYVSKYVNATKKVSFLHIVYSDAGYKRRLDEDAYSAFDRIFGVSDEVRNEFLKIYPELEAKVGVFHNLINVEKICRLSESGPGFTDDFDGTRIITVGRLHWQKSYETAIAATAVLKAAGENVRWYILGEGEERPSLEKEIKRLSLENEFILLGDVENPYPYFKECDLYVHASKFEGKSIAVQEAQILAKPIIATDCNGNREQIVNEYDGLMCELEPQKIAESIQKLIHDRETAALYGKRAHEKICSQLEKENDLSKLLLLAE